MTRSKNIALLQIFWSLNCVCAWYYWIGERGQCILFSVVLTPSPPSQPLQCFVPTCHLSLLYHCIAGAGLPNHMIGEVLWHPKRRRVWTSYCSNQSSLAILYISPIPVGRRAIFTCSNDYLPSRHPWGGRGEGNQHPLGCVMPHRIIGPRPPQHRRLLRRRLARSEAVLSRCFKIPRSRRWFKHTGMCEGICLLVHHLPLWC